MVRVCAACSFGRADDVLRHLAARGLEPYLGDPLAGLFGFHRIFNGRLPICSLLCSCCFLDPVDDARVVLVKMFSTRSTRLLILALLIAFTLLYISWDRPLAWGDVPGFAKDPAAEGMTDGKTTAPPSKGDDSPDQKNPGSSGSTPPKITDVYGADGKDENVKGEDGYDYERPSSSEDVPPPASANPEKVNEEASATPGKVEEEAPKPTVECPMSFESYMSSQPGPKSNGSRQFPLVRPPPECRTFVVPELEDYITKMESVIKDPDLYRLFQNSYPNTLDTMVKWHGYAQDNGTDTTEELSYISK